MVTNSSSARATGSANFKAYGLTVSSCMHFPELLPAEGAAEVTIRFGDVPRELPSAKVKGVRFQAEPGQFLLEVDRVARFWVQNGNEIVIDPHPDTTEDDIRLFLLGSAFAAIMQQRGILTLHGSTIKVGDECVAFLGKSGMGKSTMATTFARRGYPCLGDDVCAISIGEDGIPYATPAYPQAKLWLDTLEHFGLDPAQLRRIRPSREKRALRIDESFFADHPVPVKRLYVLSRAPQKTDPELRPVSGSAKMKLLRDFTYRIEFLRGLDRDGRHFKQIAHLASRLPITNIIRPRLGFVVDQLADVVENDFLS